MRRPLIAGNWKMHKGPSEARAFAQELVRSLGDPKDVEIVIAPPFVSLLPVWEVIKNSPIKLAAQDVFWERKGAYTGEISPPMLKECGCSYVIVGHSERRKYFGESDEVINKKVKAVLQEGLRVILCVGEKLEERERGRTLEVVRKQVLDGLQGLSSDELKNVVIAYEPVWAIGTGRNATPEQAQEVHGAIRDMIAERYGPECAREMRILYGGSVRPDNIDQLMAAPDIDGTLVGGASLEVESFVRIVNFRRNS